MFSPKKVLSSQYSVVRWTLIICLALFLSLITYHLSLVRADEIDDLQKQINSLNAQRTQSEAATKPLEGQLQNMKIQLLQIQAQLDSLTANIKQKQQELSIRETKLAELTVSFDARVDKDYRQGFLLNPLSLILGDTGKFSDRLYHLITINQNQKVISDIGSEMVGILTDKDRLEKDQAKLASLQGQVDQNAQFLGGEIGKAKAYQATLSNQIAQLSEKQQALIAAKLASLNIPRSAATSVSGCTDDRAVDPGFSPRLAAFTYGVPNRVGLNQYGAKGRAEAGQSYDTILGVYYQNYSLTDAGNPNIHVVGTNNYGQSIDMTLPLEDYLKHIYEMPASWAHEALKAQAVAARSYVLVYTNNGSGSICPSDSCQEFKQEINDGNWQSAVDDTRGKVMSSGGSPIKAWFSSTHGGYVRTSDEIGWSGTSFTKHATDTTSGSAGSFSDLQGSSYDRSSPWFYCDWGARGAYSKTAWLKPNELADIVNVILLAQRDSSTQSHLNQTDKGISDTWDESKVKSELQSRGGTPFNNVSSVSVSVDFGGGRVTGVNISGDGGSVNFDGGTFKQYFNLRAPANIQIVGPLYNFEKQ